MALSEKIWTIKKRGNHYLAFLITSSNFLDEGSQVVNRFLNAHRIHQ